MLNEPCTSQISHMLPAVRRNPRPAVPASNLQRDYRSRRCVPAVAYPDRSLLRGTPHTTALRQTCRRGRGSCIIFPCRKEGEDAAMLAPVTERHIGINHDSLEKLIHLLLKDDTCASWACARLFPYEGLPCASYTWTLKPP